MRTILRDNLFNEHIIRFIEKFTPPVKQLNASCGNLYQQYIQAMQWLKGKLNVRYDIEGQGGGPRKEIWEIPETVFKETIINAFSHLIITIKMLRLI